MMMNKLNSPAGELALQQGMTAARAGYKNLASVQLERAAELLPDNADVWLWLAWLANSPDTTRRCLQQVLAMSPGHPAATAGLIWVNSLTADASSASHIDAQNSRASITSGITNAAELPPAATTATPVMTHTEQLSHATKLTHTTQLKLDPRDGLGVTSVAETLATSEAAKAETNKNYDRDGWEVSVPATIDAATIVAVKEEVALPELAISTPALTTIKQQAQEAAPVGDEDTRQRRWNDLVSRAAEMPLHAVPSKSLATVTAEKPELAVAASVSRTVTANAIVTPAVVTSTVEVVIDPALETSVAASEATVQSRFTEVPASTPRAEPSNLSINDSGIRLRKPAPGTATPNRAQESEPESSADIEKLTQSFNPLTDAVVADGRPLVMVVDDSPTVRKLVSLTLERRGYRVISAFDGVAAIKELGSNRPDLILLDINMPRLDGYRLCKLIKKHEVTQSIPVVMLSGKDGMFDKLRGRLVGCSDYITKPFEADALTVKVAKYLTPAMTSTLS